VFQYRSTTAGYYTQPGKLCYVQPSINEPEGWQNFISTLYRCNGVFEQIVVKRWYATADAASLAFAPYYSPMGEVLYFAIRYYAQFQYSVLSKASYLVYSFIQLQPPSNGCMSILGREARIMMDYVIMSLPEFLEFFLDMSTAQESGNAHLNCQKYKYHNFIYAGAMKTFFYASKTCSARYVDQTFMQCEFENAADCPQFYELAYSDFSINALCAFDDTVVIAGLAAMKAVRGNAGAYEMAAVDVIGCLITIFKGETDVCAATLSQAINQMMALLSEAMCLLHNFGMNTVGFFGGAVLNPLFEMMYADYDRQLPNNANAFMRADPSLNAIDPNLLKQYIVSVHKRSSQCFAATSQATCYFSYSHKAPTSQKTVDNSVSSVNSVANTIQNDVNQAFNNVECALFGIGCAGGGGNGVAQTFVASSTDNFDNVFSGGGRRILQDDTTSTCYWTGNACVYRPSQNTGFLNTQPYILEASVITWGMSVFNLLFWMPNYVIVLQIQRYAALFNGVNLDNANSIVSTALQGMLESTSFDYILDEIRIFTIAIRDFMIATM
jgi:hypothetical protein